MIWVTVSDWDENFFFFNTFAATPSILFYIMPHVYLLFFLCAVSVGTDTCHHYKTQQQIFITIIIQIGNESGRCILAFHIQFLVSLKAVTMMLIWETKELQTRIASNTCSVDDRISLFINQANTVYIFVNFQLSILKFSNVTSPGVLSMQVLLPTLFFLLMVTVFFAFFFFFLGMISLQASFL